MGTHHRAVHHAILRVGIIGKVFKHPFPYPMVTPARKALVDTIPLPILGGQQAPLGATATYPLHGFNETSALDLVSHRGIRVLFQEIPNFPPLIVR
jgi:hypothetical protein